MSPLARLWRALWVPEAAFALIVALSRLPLLGSGYGSDDDAWRNVVAAVRMHRLGHYVPSRAPGFPVFETLLSWLAPFGWLATNGVTALAGVIAALVFVRVARRIGVAMPGVLGLGFAFCSGLWITTSQTMDYAYGLAFMLAAYLALLERRHLAGGVLLALAAGCRLTLAGQLLAAAALLLSRRAPARAWAALAGGFAVTFALEFLPVLRSPELGDLRHEAAYHVAHAHLTLHTLVPLTRAALVFTFGRFGVAVLALALLVVAAGRLRAPRAGSAPARAVAFERGPVAYEATGAAVTAACFALVPYENAYLLPAVPFVLLLLARVLRPAWIVALVAALTLEPLVTVSVGARQFVPGNLFLERSLRRADLAESQVLAALAPDAPTVYVVGRFRVHRLLLLAPRFERLGPAYRAFSGPGVALWQPGRHVGYAATLTAPQRDSLAAAGYAIAPWPADASAEALPAR